MFSASSEMILGAYIWDGLPASGLKPGRSSLGVASGIIAGSGLNSIRLVVNLQQLKAAGINTLSCASPVRVDCFLNDADFVGVINNPNFDVVALTLHETTLTGWKMADFAAMQSLSEESRREFRKFLVGLLPIMKKNPNKTIIITNREGDHSIYCGSTSRFIDSIEFRSVCIGAAASGRSALLDSRRDALIQWYRGRQSDIESFRKTYGLGKQILHAIEFNTVHRMVDFEKKIGLDLPQTLFDVIPQVGPDLCSYSAYSSFNNGYSFAADLAEIRRICANSPIIIGELGFSSEGRDADKLSSLYRKALMEARRAGVRAVFFWQGFESHAAGKAYGLFHKDGTEMQWRYIKNVL